MRAAFAAAVAGTTAYPGEAPPERSRLPNDWRRFLDLVQGETKAADGAEVADLVAEVALDEADRKVLPARASARQALADLIEAGGEWAAPVVVRMAMDRWHFDDAGRRWTGRPTCSRSATRSQGLPRSRTWSRRTDPRRTTRTPGASRSRRHGGGCGPQPRGARQVAGASDVVEAPRDWFTEVGLDGADQRPGWRRRGPPGSVRTSMPPGARRPLPSSSSGGSGGGPDEGPDDRTGAPLALMILAAIAVILARRRSGTARRARAAAMAVAGIGTPPDPPGPYATLPPEGPPAGPPGRPPSGDEGADPS